MKFKLNKSLLKSSFILLVAFNIFNILNFLFHFFMARMLTVSEYGIFLTLFSIIYFLAIFTESIQLVLTKYSSQEKNKGKLKNMLKKSLKKAAFVSVIILIAYSVVAFPLSKYVLKIDYILMLLTGLMVVDAFLIPVTRGVIQGTKRFFGLGANMVVESFSKIVLAVIFVAMGWKVFGAMLGTVLGVSLAFGLSFLSLKDILSSKEKKAETHDIYGYTKPTFLVIIAILAFFTIDIFIVKSLFSEGTAGIYSIASILAKTIFFGTQPIARAMFPLSSGNKKIEKSENIFHNALAILIPIILVALVFFYFIPDFIIRVFSGRYIPEAANLLLYVGIAMGFVSIANLVLFYKLSLTRLGSCRNFIIFSVIDLVLLVLFSVFYVQNLFQFSIALITASSVFLFGSIVLMND